MGQFDESIIDLTVGRAFDIERTVKEIPSGRTLAKAWITIKESAFDADPGVIQKTITTTLTADGQITDTGADGTGAFIFTLGEAVTALLTAQKVYDYDIQTELDNGNASTFEIGTILPLRAVTQAT